MKTKVMDVTPEFALKTLERTNQLVAEGKMTQRKICDSDIEMYARAMRSGRWVLHHQGIAISEEGGCLDGQHRLEAIIRSGCTVPLSVAFDVPVVAFQNGYKLLTIDAMDGQRVRRTGVKLGLHGIANGNELAAICRAICVAMTGDIAVKIGMPETLYILELYRKEIAACKHDKAWRKNSTITAAIIMGMAAGEAGFVFANQYFLGDHKANDPANAIKRWYGNSYRRDGQFQINIMRSVAYCLLAHFEGRSLERVIPSEHALAWLLDQQGRRANKIRGLFESTSQTVS